VADPFLGLGSTAVACAQLGLSFIGIEVDEGYLNEAVERTRAVLSQPPLIAGTHRRQ
jgi:site-specific DNA-methyltransferase (adenine-specific)